MKPPAPTEVYRCLACEHRWMGIPWPQTCPECGHLMVEWVSYRDGRFPVALVGR